MTKYFSIILIILAFASLSVASSDESLSGYLIGHWIVPAKTNQEGDTYPCEIYFSDSTVVMIETIDVSKRV